MDNTVITKSYLECSSNYIYTFNNPFFNIYIYKLTEALFEDRTKDWFWAIKGTPKKEGVIFFIVGLIIVLAIALYFV